MPATFLWFLFDWRGRISRSAYRIAWLVLALFAASMEYLPARSEALLAGMAVAQLAVALALDSKRLHDVGLSVAWLVATSVAGVALVGALAYSIPELTHALREGLTESIGARASASPLLCVALAGVGLGAALRAPFLWALPSRDAGAVYDYDPRVRALKAKPEAGAVGAGVEAALAQALIDRRLEQAAAAMAQTDGDAKKTGRKAFGRRVA